MSLEILLTPREVAELLGVRTTTLARWARLGALEPAVRTPGGHRRYRRADVEAFIEAASTSAGRVASDTTGA